MNMNVLVSGASFAGLCTAYWLKRLGHQVTVVEIASGLRTGGTAVNIQGNTIEVAKRMGIFEQIRANQLSLMRWDFKNAADVSERSMVLRADGDPPSEDDLEIERDVLLELLFNLVKHDVEFIFGDSIGELNEADDAMHVRFKHAGARSFDLVCGCDGAHSTVRKLWFGGEAEYTHFLEQYFSITIVDKLLIERNTAQLFNTPGKAVMLNAYKNKTDIIFGFVSEQELDYDRRDEAQQRRLISERFAGEGWRTTELLSEVQASTSFYFDKLCQIRMPSWTRGRVALVGDAGYCASPAAGLGGSLAIDGAAALADAMQEHAGNLELAFRDYNRNFRPFIERVQADAVRTGLETLVPRTEEAIRMRNAQTAPAF